MADERPGTSTVQFTSHNSGKVTGTVTKAGHDESLLNIEINALDIGREKVGGISPENTVASVMTIIALTWAT